jgi:hypothetical protein
MKTAPAIILAGAIASAALPALAELPYRTRHEADRLISRCISGYGEEHADRCVEIIDGARARAGRARRDYWDRHDYWDRREIERMQRCLDDPGVVSPRLCARRWHDE